MYKHIPLENKHLNADNYTHSLGLKLIQVYLRI